MASVAPAPEDLAAAIKQRESELETMRQRLEIRNIIEQGVLNRVYSMTTAIHCKLSEQRVHVKGMEEMPVLSHDQHIRLNNAKVKIAVLENDVKLLDTYVKPYLPEGGIESDEELHRVKARYALDALFGPNNSKHPLYEYDRFSDANGQPKPTVEHEAICKLLRDDAVLCKYWSELNNAAGSLFSLQTQIITAFNPVDNDDVDRVKQLFCETAMSGLPGLPDVYGINSQLYATSPDSITPLHRSIWKRLDASIPEMLGFWDTLHNELPGYMDQLSREQELERANAESLRVYAAQMRAQADAAAEQQRAQLAKQAELALLKPMLEQLLMSALSSMQASLATAPAAAAPAAAAPVAVPAAASAAAPVAVPAASHLDLRQKLRASHAALDRYQGAAV